MKRRAAIASTIALILITIAMFGAFNVISTSAVSANDEPQRDGNVGNDHEGIQAAGKALERLISEGKGESLVSADIQLNEGIPPKQLASFVHQYQLTVKQLKFRITGLSEDLSGGYVIQPGQTIEQALDQFASLQQPFFTRKIVGIEDDCNLRSKSGQ